MLEMERLVFGVAVTDSIEYRLLRRLRPVGATLVFLDVLGRLLTELELLVTGLRLGAVVPALKERDRTDEAREVLAVDVDCEGLV